MSRRVYVLGVDENGLGPRLGPLVTTGVLVRLPAAYDEVALRAIGAERGLTDSKAVASTRAMRFCEGVALALAEAHAPCDRSAQLLAGLHLDGAVGLRSPCPDEGTARMCHGADRRLPCHGGDAAEGRQALSPFRAARGPRVVRVRSVVRCVGTLNAEHAKGRNKLVVDLASMERLVLDARAFVDATGGGRLLALCGMVGGIREVPRFFSHLAADQTTPLVETRLERHYRVEGVGDVHFDVDADARHLPVALASLVGKYLRELAMGHVTDFHRAHDPALPVPSGYHDPVTARFVAQSEPIRRRLAIAPGCFERVG